MTLDPLRYYTLNYLIQYCSKIHMKITGQEHKTAIDISKERKKFSKQPTNISLVYFMPLNNKLQMQVKLDDYQLIGLFQQVCCNMGANSRNPGSYSFHFLFSENAMPEKVRKKKDQTNTAKCYGK